MSLKMVQRDSLTVFFLLVAVEFTVTENAGIREGAAASPCRALVHVLVHVQGAAVVWLPPASNLCLSNAGASGSTDVGDMPRRVQIKSGNCLKLHKKSRVCLSGFMEAARLCRGATGERSAAAAVNI